MGGELKSYTDMMDQARALATQRMEQEAEALGADAVVNIRYSSASVMQGAARSDGLRHRRPVQRVIPSHCASKASSFFKLDACH